MKRGQSIFEILIALGIFGVISGAAIFLFFSGQSLTIDSTNEQSVVNYANEGIEAVRSIKERDWAELTDGPHGLIFNGSQWVFSGVSDTRDIFSRIVTITASSTNPNVKDIKVAVNWQISPIRPLKVELNSIVTNWKNPFFGGCSSDPLSGNWANPVVIGSADLGPGNEGTDVVVKLPYVFVSAVASAANKSDLFVFNVSNPVSPSLVRQIDIGSGGINSLFLKDNYLYAASANDSRELIIFNVADPPNTSELGTFNLTGSANGLSVIAFSNTVAVGRSESATNELAFINVSNPGSPTLISETAINGDVNDFYSTNQRLYAVSAEANKDIWIYDIINPANPTFISSYDIPNSDEELSIYFQQKAGAFNLLVGNEEDELVLIGATTTSQMYIRDKLNLGGNINDIVCVGNNLAFLATSNTNKEFVTVNIANPDNITEYASLNFPQQGTGIDFADNKIFMSVRSNDALRIITSQ